jgi:histidine ammonia-lyase
MGATSALKSRRALERLTDVVGIELLCAAEALEYQRPLRSGAGVEAAFAAVREVVPRRTGDRPPAPDIAALGRLIRDGRFIDTGPWKGPAPPAMGTDGQSPPAPDAI